MALDWRDFVDDLDLSQGSVVHEEDDIEGENVLYVSENPREAYRVFNEYEKVEKVFPVGGLEHYPPSRESPSLEQVVEFFQESNRTREEGDSGLTVEDLKVPASPGADHVYIKDTRANIVDENEAKGIFTSPGDTVQGSGHDLTDFPYEEAMIMYMDDLRVMTEEEGISKKHEVVPRNDSGQSYQVMEIEKAPITAENEVIGLVGTSTAVTSEIIRDLDTERFRKFLREEYMPAVDDLTKNGVQKMFQTDSGFKQLEQGLMLYKSLLETRTESPRQISFSEASDFVDKIRFEPGESEEDPVFFTRLNNWTDILSDIYERASVGSTPQTAVDNDSILIRSEVWNPEELLPEGEFPYEDPLTNSIAVMEDTLNFEFQAGESTMKISQNLREDFYYPQDFSDEDFIEPLEPIQAEELENRT